MRKAFFYHFNHDSTQWIFYHSFAVCIQGIVFFVTLVVTFPFDYLAGIDIQLNSEDDNFIIVIRNSTCNAENLMRGFKFQCTICRLTEASSYLGLPFTQNYPHQFVGAFIYLDMYLRLMIHTRSRPSPERFMSCILPSFICPRRTSSPPRPPPRFC